MLDYDSVKCWFRIITPKRILDHLNVKNICLFIELKPIWQWDYLKILVIEDICQTRLINRVYQIESHLKILANVE